MRAKIMKISASILIVISNLCFMTSCVDYGYEFHYSVIGENGRVEPEWGGDTSPIVLRGGKNGQQLRFYAFPNEGYQVKEWKCNGVIIEENKTSSYLAVINDYKQTKIIVTVEFELIQ